MIENLETSSVVGGSRNNQVAPQSYDVLNQSRYQQQPASQVEVLHQQSNQKQHSTVSFYPQQLARFEQEEDMERDASPKRASPNRPRGQAKTYQNELKSSSTYLPAHSKQDFEADQSLHQRSRIRDYDLGSRNTEIVVLEERDESRER